MNFKVARYFLAVFVAVGFLEVASYVYTRVALGPITWTAKGWQEFSLKRSSVLESQVVHDQGVTGDEILHPYLGFAFDPKIRYPKYEGKPDPLALADFGLSPMFPPFTETDSNQVIFGIFGGSVAGHLPGMSRNTFIQALKEHPRFKDKKIIITDLSLAGFKQPQQLLTLTYALSLGVKLDYIINIDGFSDMIFATVENIPMGVHPIFPHQWYNRVQRGALMESLSRHTWRRIAAAEWSDFFPFRHSATANLLWWLFDDWEASQINNLKSKLTFEGPEGPSKTVPLVARGPKFNKKTDSEVYEEIARYWVRSSMMMYQLGKENNIPYFHFLQPNQYYPNVKVLTEEEKSQAVDESSRYGKAAAEAYPYFVKAGKLLSQKGVPFKDLSQLFSNTAETIFVDTCCHMNKMGNDAVAKEVASTILQHIENSPPAKTRRE